jgi:rhodanese-related sulfurtransferase
MIEDKEDFLLLDVRTEEEFNENKIEGAINIPLQDLLYNLDELEEYADKKIVVYCRSGHRSVTACNLLNIEGFNNVGIPVGIYFYSYANSKESAIRDANWVLEQIRGYKIDLPIVYDWESWSFYNEFNQSFYSLSMSAKAYLDTMKNAGYQGMLYSSKNYLEKAWFNIGYDIWLAHYTTKTSYTGPYKYWQMCSNGKIDGIAGNVDINIYYQ